MWTATVQMPTPELVFLYEPLGLSRVQDTIWMNERLIKMLTEIVYISTVTAVCLKNQWSSTV